MLRRLIVTLLALLAAASATAVPAKAPVKRQPVLLISIDGLRPGDVLEAEKRGLKIPNLRRFLSEGSYASGVRGVIPTITYPSHATLLTGASPARHGILANQTFDPLQINAAGWFWYASDFKVPTLWQAAHDAGMRVGNVHWPVSVGATGIDWNLPQYWRSGHADDAKLLAQLATPGLLTELERARGEAYAQGIVEDVGGDENRGRFAVELIQRHKPGFITVYFTGYDHQQHEDGPGSASAHAVLERIDASLGRVIAAERAVHPGAVIALVSDHGFAPVTREVNLFRLFIDKGLITLDGTGKVKSWDAMPWPMGGSVGVVYARGNDAALYARVWDVIAPLLAGPDPLVRTVAKADTAGLDPAGPMLGLYLDLPMGTSAGKFVDRDKGLVGVPGNKGTHGWFPDAPEMRASFMIMGPGIPKGRNLGDIDQRAIAPTLAEVMGLRLTGAEVPGLSLKTR